MTATRKQGAAVAPGSAARGTVGATLRVLIYIEDRHCTYREAIAELLQSRCPHVEVSVGGLCELEAELLRLDPHVVVHAGSRMPVPDHCPLLGRALARSCSTDSGATRRDPPRFRQPVLLGSARGDRPSGVALPIVPNRRTLADRSPLGGFFRAALRS